MFNFSLPSKTKFLLAVLVLVSSLGLLIKVTRTEDFTVTCDDSGCISPVIAIYNESGVLPGQSFERTMAVENNRSEDVAVKLSAGKKSETNDIFLDVLSVSIRNSDDSLISSSSLADFLNGTKLDLGNITTGTRKSLKIRIDFDQNANNSYQGKKVVFDIYFDVAGDDVGGGGGGTVVGASAPVCTDIKPGLPTNFIVSGLGAEQVILSWGAPPAPYTYFLVAYSDNSFWPPKWGNPDVGNVTTYTVSGLGAGSYWFWVRAGNDCMPGDFVGPISPGAVAGVAGTSAVAEGFSPEILGAKELGGEPAPEVKGASCLGKNYLWWLPLIFEAILILGYYIWLIRKNVFSLRWIIIPLILGAISQYLHEVWGCNCATNVWCPRYWLFNLLILVITFLFWRFLRREE